MDTEQTEDKKHTKDLEIGRIVIQEIPEEEKDEQKFHRKEEVSTECMEVTLTRHEVDETHTVQKEIVNVGKLNVTCLEKHPMESTKREERPLADGIRKVILKNSWYWIRLQSCSN